MEELVELFNISKYHAKLISGRMTNTELEMLKLLLRHKLVATSEVRVEYIANYQKEVFVVYSIDNICVYRKTIIERKLRDE